MDELLPFLEVSGPEGQAFRTELTRDRVTIGRFEVYNDIALEPDPQQLITRKGHCTVERDMGGWWVVDNGSVNRTFLRHEGVMDMVQGRAILASGDTICLLGKLTEGGAPLYWELTFSDPLGTQPARQTPQLTYLDYDWLQAKLFRVDRAGRQEIGNLRPQEHKLIRYMAQRNRTNGHVPVMCTNEELLIAIWGEEPYHTETEANRLIWELRKKVEPDPKEPTLLQTVRGLGYRLVTRPW